jgi:hypothetical protein
MSDRPNPEPARIAREKRTISAMVEIYCRAHHRGSGSVCGECAALRDYAFCRLDRCPFGADKTTCARCPIHCYKPSIKDRVKEIMRYAGPRMIYRHPILALLHQLDALRSRRSAAKGSLE